MRKQLLHTFAVLIIATAGSAARASAQTPAPGKPAADAPAVNPVGSFAFTITMGGGTANGVLDIKQAEGKLSGTATLEGATPPTVPLKDITVKGQDMTVVVDAPDGDATFSLKFTGDDFAGTLDMGPNSAPVTGKRVAAAKS
jgi:hypothetical protein